MFVNRLHHIYVETYRPSIQSNHNVMSELFDVCIDLSCRSLSALHPSPCPALPSRVVLPVSVEEVSTNGGQRLNILIFKKKQSSMFHLYFSRVESVSQSNAQAI